MTITYVTGTRGTHQPMALLLRFQAKDLVSLITTFLLISSTPTYSPKDVCVWLIHTYHHWLVCCLCLPVLPNCHPIHKIFFLSVDAKKGISTNLVGQVGPFPPSVTINICWLWNESVGFPLFLMGKFALIYECFG